MSKSDYLSPNTYTELYRVMQRDNVLAIRVSLETGLRIDDVLSLKWDSFVSAKKFTYRAQKTGKKGTKRLSSSLAAELSQRSNHKSEYVFPGRKLNRHRTRQAVWKDIKKAAAMMGVVLNACPHSARKTYAVELRKEKGLAEVQKELQHTDMTTTMLYAFADMAKGSSTRHDAFISSNELLSLADMIARRVVDLLLEEKAKRKGQD